MDIFEFAKEKEKFSEHYYLQLADKTNHKGLSNICKMLAEEESKHYQVVQNMQNNTNTEVTKTPSLQYSQKLFESMRKSAEKFNFDISELELYQKARDIEQESKKLYLDLSRKVELPAQKEIFVKLADEEQKHYVLIDKICDFVARPKWFLENAEMYRFDDYAGGVL